MSHSNKLTRAMQPVATLSPIAISPAATKLAMTSLPPRPALQTYWDTVYKHYDTMTPVAYPEEKHYFVVSSRSSDTLTRLIGLYRDSAGCHAVCMPELFAWPVRFVRKM